MSYDWSKVLEQYEAGDSTALDEAIGPTSPSQGDALSRRKLTYCDEQLTEPPMPVDKGETDPELIARLDLACDPRSGGIGGFGHEGLNKIRAISGYEERRFRDLLKHSDTDFIYAVTPEGVTTPQSITTRPNSAAYYTTSNSASAMKENQAAERSKRVPGWHRAGKITDVSGGSRNG